MLKSFLKKIVPAFFWRLLKRILFVNKTKDAIDEKYAGKSISNIFSDIYENDEWAIGNEGKFKETGSKFYSGSGSYNNAAIKYIEFINNYVNENSITSITDIGCGDFNIGSQIIKLNPAVKYAGVDVVEQLINYNNQHFSNERVKFYCLDTLRETVPTGELLLVRQVLQHLSNDDISKLITNCFPGFKHILITEHQIKPSLLIKKNIDKESGPNIRAAFGSGVYLNTSPFNKKWQEKLIVDDVDNSDCQIITYEMEM